MKNKRSTFEELILKSFESVKIKDIKNYYDFVLKLKFLKK